MKPVILDRLTWEEIRNWQSAGNDMVLLPIGATEQHGPHLPINTDTCIGESVCRYASAHAQVALMPAQAYTVSSGHTPKWPGTFSLRHDTFINLLVDLADWIVATGWRRLLIVNSHFGNDASMRVAVEKIRLRHLGELQVGAVNTFHLSEEIWKQFSADADDLHANKAETDLMLHLAEDAVKMDRVKDDPDRTVDSVFSYPVAQTSLNGITGEPSKGNAANGETLFNLMGEALTQLINRAISEQPPLAEDQWHTVRESIATTI